MKNIRFHGLFIGLVATMLLGGCSSVAKIVFGIKELKAYDQRTVDSFLEESQRRMACIQIVATSNQVDSTIRLDPDSNMMQHRAQPVQILYFEGDSLLFYHINCYTQNGFLSFDWNNYGSFNSFPPKPSIVADTHKCMTMENFRAIYPEITSTTNYTVVIIWSNLLRKVSQKAVATVADNINNRDDCSVVLINTDHWWVDYLN